MNVSQMPNTPTLLTMSTTEAKARKAFAAVAGALGSLSSVPCSKMEDLLENLGENTSGDELAAQITICDPSGSGSITLEHFVAWYVKFVDGGDDDDDDVDDEEVQEEREKAAANFDDLDKEGAGVLPADRFEELFEKMGSTYDPDDHGRALKKGLITNDEGLIAKSKFISWYIDFLFNDNDESDLGSSDGDEDESFAKKGEMLGTWSASFGARDGWKCEICLVNGLAEELLFCPACDSVRKGKEEEAALVKKAPAGSSDLKPAAAAFKPGSFATASPAASGISFGFGPAGGAASAAGASGFSFGFSATDAAPPPSSAGAGGGFSFSSAGAKAPGQTPAPPAAPAGGGFSFGGAAAMPPLPPTAEAEKAPERTEAF